MEDRSMFYHLRSCGHFNYKLNFFGFAIFFSDNGTIDHLKYFDSAVNDNCKIFHAFSNWTIFQYFEAYDIKK